MTDQPQIAGTLLTRDEVAGLLTVTPRTLYRWELLHRGPPSIKIGRVSYYRREALDDWLLRLEGISSVATVARRKV